MGSENSSELSVPGSALIIGGLSSGPAAGRTRAAGRTHAALTRLSLYDLLLHGRSPPSTSHACALAPQNKLFYTLLSCWADRKFWIRLPMCTRERAFRDCCSSLVAFRRRSRSRGTYMKKSRLIDIPPGSPPWERRERAEYSIDRTFVRFAFVGPIVWGWSGAGGGMGGRPKAGALGK